MKHNYPGEDFQTEMQLPEALRRLLSDKKSHTTSLNYATGYIKEAVRMMNEGAPYSELNTQILYVLNNITHYRGRDHKEIRQCLKTFCGIK